MLLFQPPPSTPYDLRFMIAGIPVRVHPLFWLVGLILGYSLGLVGVILWIIVVFVSILIHELGHAFMMRFYGQRSQIILHAAGGLTVPESVWWGSRYADIWLGPTEEILVSLAGPFAGFFLAALVVAIVKILGGSIGIGLLGIIPIPVATLPGGGILNSLVGMLLWVNIFWGVINLMPVYPLDGGNVTRYILLQSDPVDGVRKSLWISVIAGGLIAVFGLLSQNIFMALLFGFLAFQSYQSLQARF